MIAVISQVYADVVEKQEATLYAHRASLNYDFLMLQKFCNNCEPFSILVLSLDKDDRTSKGEDWEEFVDVIKQFTIEQHNALNKKMNSIYSSIEDD